MRGIKAKKIRRMVYGDLSLRGRKYFVSRGGYVVSDELRQKYQLFKKLSHGKN